MRENRAWKQVGHEIQKPKRENTPSDSTLKRCLYQELGPVRLATFCSSSFIIKSKRKKERKVKKGGAWYISAFCSRNLEWEIENGTSMRQLMHPWLWHIWPTQPTWLFILYVFFNHCCFFFLMRPSLAILLP